MTKPKKNDLLTLEVDHLTDLGFGVARADGFVVFLSGAVPGETVEAKIIKVTSSYAVGRVERVLCASDVRDGGRCALPCRACAYKAVKYGYELSEKEAGVLAAFRKAGLSDVKVHPVTPSPKSSEYRNKAEYPIARGADGSYKIGFYQPKSHTVTEAADCPLAPGIFREILDTVRGYFEKHALSVYDEESGDGLLRHVYLRRGEISGEILLSLVIAGDALPDEEGLVRAVVGAFPAVVGILINENREKTNVILGEKWRVLYGRDYLVDTLAGVKLRIAAPAFYQVNHGAAELLYAKAKELAAPGKLDTLLDLYCGAGSIGLSMAKEAGEVIGIEIVPAAVECANENAKENGAENAHFYVGDAGDCEKLLANAESALGRKISPDVILLDPPRAGCEERLIRFVSSLSPKRIVYVSCNPSTLARDCAIFAEEGFRTREAFPFDLFPGTGHVETVVLMSRDKE